MHSAAAVQLKADSVLVARGAPPSTWKISMEKAAAVSTMSRRNSLFWLESRSMLMNSSVSFMYSSAEQGVLDGVCRNSLLGRQLLHFWQ